MKTPCKLSGCLPPDTAAFFLLRCTWFLSTNSHVESQRLMWRPRRDSYSVSAKVCWAARWSVVSKDVSTDNVKPAPACSRPCTLGWSVPIVPRRGVTSCRGAEYAQHGAQQLSSCCSILQPLCVNWWCGSEFRQRGRLRSLLWKHRHSRLVERLAKVMSPAGNPCLLLWKITIVSFWLTTY